MFGRNSLICRDWPWLAVIGRNWPRFSVISRNWPWVAEIGRDWPRFTVFSWLAFVLALIAWVAFCFTKRFEWINFWLFYLARNFENWILIWFYLNLIWKRFEYLSTNKRACWVAHSELKGCVVLFYYWCLSIRFCYAAWHWNSENEIFWIKGIYFAKFWNCLETLHEECWFDWLKFLKFW